MKFLKSDISSTLAAMRIELNEHEAKWSVALGLVLRKTRKQADLAQEEVAYKAGTGRLTMQRIEYGATSPNLVTLLRLCGALEIAPSILFAEAEKLMQHPKKLEAAIEARDAEHPPTRARLRNA
ncbi:MULTISPECIES: helix-turn-helix domain-containing protein [Delftia]|jgi:transcriptional regulator with XRE-family HTH domain|uniref:Helix-turn-helix domain-containing protein n=1 Tax=Delftia deserti TaxID=1651218 RepID=A0ABW5EVZ6_9BURK|nr:helix-turn-helix transcriptional regulator [Delftia sp. ASV31]